MVFICIQKSSAGIRIILANHFLRVTSPTFYIIVYHSSLIRSPIHTYKHTQNPRPVSKRKTLTSSGYQTPGCVLPSKTALTNAEMQMPTDLNDKHCVRFYTKVSTMNCKLCHDSQNN